jgi:hypothetical protein
MYVRPKAKVRFPANALAERTELAALVGECIAFWSHVEAQIAILLAAIMKAETAIASAVFLSIRNSRAQREALAEAAKVALKDRELEMFSAIAMVYQSLDGQRSDLAHGVFAMSDDLPDAILWVDAKDFTKHTVENWVEQATDNLPFPAATSDDAVKQSMFVYRKNDLMALRDDIKEFWKAVFLFGLYLRLSSSGMEIIEKQFQRLYDVPPIQRALSRLRGG